MKWRNWLTALIGVWLIFSPWVFGFANHSGAMWTSVIAGAIQLVVAVWAVGRPEETANWSNPLNWIALIMGAWFIIQPWTVSISSMTGNTWDDVIFGAITVILSLWTMGAGTDVGNSGGNRRRAA